MPWKIFDGRCGSTSTVISDWPSMSMKPGATIVPRGVDLSACAVAPARRPIAAMRPSRMPTSAAYHGDPGAVDDVAVDDEDVVTRVGRPLSHERDRGQDGQENRDAHRPSTLGHRPSECHRLARAVEGGTMLFSRKYVTRLP